MNLNISLKLQLLLLQLFSLTFGTLYFFDGSDDELLKRNNLIAKLTSWGKRYYVIFKLKPLSYSRDWESVIHFTVGEDNSRNGDRIPGFWFAPYGSAILNIVCSANGYQQAIYSPPLLLNSWSTIQVCQDIVDGNYLTSAYINGKLVQSIVNNNPQTFENVLVYAADPWYVATDGYIKDLKVIAGNDNLIEDLKEHALIKDNLVATLPLLEKTFSFSFKVKPNLYNTINFTSVIHLTIGGDYGYYGYRTPGVWLTSEGKMKICSSVNGNYDYNILTEPLYLNEWSSIRISQFELNKIYMYAVYLNGKIIHSIKNTQPEAFTNVNVYATNPWHNAQDGFIKDLRIINGNEETCDLKTMLSSSIQNEEIHIRINLTTNCECYLQNVTLHLQPDKLLIFKKFSWDDSSLNDSFVEIDGNFIFVDIPKLSKDLPAWFSAIFVNVKNLHGRINGSMEGYSKWSYCYGDPVFKFNQLNFNMPIIERTPVKMNPILSSNQPNQAYLQTETYQFVCTNMHKRQPSPCYQRELSTGIITFYSIQLLNIIGYDSSNQVIYGRTHRSNVIEMNLNNRKPLIITKERCSKIKACKPFISEN
ncbi:uncharacterized protein LOC136089417 [Hydra vulgaris]|uniref:Uncharacterized protein LOC136089417 n=1 Tax=Hydra vulgaris TaxID=6087 RepID=A0ABM4DAT4_HYDVU